MKRQKLLTLIGCAALALSLALAAFFCVNTRIAPEIQITYETQVEPTSGDMATLLQMLNGGTP